MSQLVANRRSSVVGHVLDVFVTCLTHVWDICGTSEGLLEHTWQELRSELREDVETELRWRVAHALW